MAPKGVAAKRFLVDRNGSRRVGSKHRHGTEKEAVEPSEGDDGGDEGGMGSSGNRWRGMRRSREGSYVRGRKWCCAEG